MDTQQTIEWHQHLDRGSDFGESPSMQHEQPDTEDVKSGLQRQNAASRLSVAENEGAIASDEARAPGKVEEAESPEPPKDLPDHAKASPDEAENPEPMKDLPDYPKASSDQHAKAKSPEPVKDLDLAKASSDQHAEASPEPVKDLDLAKASPNVSTGSPRMSAPGEAGSPQLLDCQVGLGPFILCPNSY